MRYNIIGKFKIYHNEEDCGWDFAHRGWGDESEY